MLRFNWFVFVLGQFVALLAYGQTINSPRFFVAGHYAGGTNGINPWEPHPYVTSMIFVPVTDYTAAGAAQYAAAEAQRRINAGVLASNEIAIWLWEFGLDDSIQSDQLPEQAIRLFRPGDLLPASWFIDTDFPQPAFRDARRYRHPFLSNAVCAVPCTAPSGLRGWMKEFVDNWPANVPAPSRFHFDNESFISVPASANSVYMVWQLAQNRTWTFNGVTGGTWTGLPVPGYPPGTTLASLYAAAALQFGFPASILDPQYGIDAGPFVSTSASAPRNRAIMLWYYRVANRAFDSLLRNSAYEVIHARWPSCKVGNYADANADGENDLTGWFVDWNDPFATANDDCVPRRGLPPPSSSCDALKTPKKYYPRSLASGDDVCAWMLGTSSGRWAALLQYASGDVDSPAVYEFPETIDSAKQAIWYQQPNLYMPASTYVAPQACYDAVNVLPPTNPNYALCAMIRHETALRLKRQAVESIINSKRETQPSPGGMNSDRLVPWLDMFWQRGPSGERLVQELQIRNSLAMYRAKNIKEGIFFSGIDTRVPANVTKARQVWHATAEVTERVYSAHVLSWARLRGTLPSGSAMDYDPTRLEFTLRDATGNDRTADLQADSTGVSELKVTIDGLSNYATWAFEVNVECSVNQNGVKGMLFALNMLNGKWVAVPAVVRQPLDDCQPPSQVEYLYEFTPPLQDARRKFFLAIDQSPPDGQPQLFVSAPGQMVLKFVHTKASVAVISKYDLVQVIPYSPGCPTSNGGGCAAACPLVVNQSDKNYDNFVDAGDLLQFMDDYAQGKISADIDNDGDVNEDDVVLYMAYYVNES